MNNDIESVLYTQNDLNNRMDEMAAEQVVLVVPKAYISTYSRDRQDRIWTISKFVNYLKEKEGK